MSKLPTEPRDWSRASEALFRSGRTDHAATSADRQRVREALAQRLAASRPAITAGDSPLGVASTSNPAVWALAKIGLGVSIAIACVAAFMFTRVDESKHPSSKPAIRAGVENASVSEHAPSTPATSSVVEPSDRDVASASPAASRAQSSTAASRVRRSTEATWSSQVSTRGRRRSQPQVNRAAPERQSFGDSTSAAADRVATADGATTVVDPAAPAIHAPRRSEPASSRVAPAQPSMGNPRSAADRAAAAEQSATVAERSAAAQQGASAAAHSAVADREGALGAPAASDARHRETAAQDRGAEPRRSATSVRLTDRGQDANPAIPANPAAETNEEDSSEQSRRAQHNASIAENDAAPAAAAAAFDPSDPRAELLFVRRIQAADRDGAPREVLALCAEHERRWPRGTFVQEREGLRAIASCESDRRDAATRATRFFAAYPQSPLLPRIRQACAARVKATTGGRLVATPGG